MLVLALRAVLLYLVVYGATRVMGKREIGQLQPYEFVLTVMLADLVSSPIEGADVPMLYGVVPVLGLLVVHLCFSALSLHHRRVRALLCGSPVVLVEGGKVDQQMMKQLRINMDDLTEQLRLQGYFSMAEVSIAVLETGGKLSVMASNAPAAGELSYCIINDGTPSRHNLKRLQVDDAALQKLLHRYGYSSCKEVYFASLTPGGTFWAQRKEDA